MNKEFNGFDEMVEALEENEDMVECKECFELFPKVDCERTAVGYVCPVCRRLRTPVAQAKFEDPYDCYTQDFPEVQDYDPGTMTDYEEEPSLGDALSDLIKDEYEAIDGYEIADETVQHATIDGDTKDEILDILDHIKEEEEEHIDELKELCPECDPAAEPKAEPEKLEEAAAEEATDEEPEAEEIPEEGAEDSEKNENEEVSDLETAYEAALEIANESGVGQVFGYARKETEEFVAIEPFEVDDPDAVEDDLMAAYDDVAYAYVAYPGVSLQEALFEDAQLNEGPLDFLANKNAAKIFDKLLPSGYIIICTTDNSNRFNKQKIKTYDKAVAALKLAAKTFPKDSFGLTVANTRDLQTADNDIQKLFKDANYTFLFYKNGKVEFGEGKTLAKQVKQLEKAIKKMAKLGGTSATTTDRDAATAAVRAGAEDSETEAPETEDPEATDAPEPDPEPDTEPEAAPASEDDSDLEDEEEEKTVEDYRKEALGLLGEKKPAEGYTEESYAAYSAKYDDLSKKINGAKKLETFVDSYLPKLPAIVDKMNKLLKPAEDEEDEELEPTDTETSAPEATSEETASAEDPEEPTPEDPEESPETGVDEDSKKKEQADKIKKGFKDIFGKDISDETAEKLRTMLFTESLHEKINNIDSFRDIADDPNYIKDPVEKRLWKLAVEFIDLYISGTPGNSDGFNVSFKGLKGYKAIEAEKDTYTEESFKKYDNYISANQVLLQATSAARKAGDKQPTKVWEDEIVKKLKEAESWLVKKEAVSEATTSTSEDTGTPSEAEATGTTVTPEDTGATSTTTPEGEDTGTTSTSAKKPKVDVATMNRQRANSNKLRKAIQSIPELSDIANELVTVNKKGKNVLSPKARELRKAIFGESLQEAVEPVKTKKDLTRKALERAAKEHIAFVAKHQKADT